MDSVPELQTVRMSLAHCLHGDPRSLGLLDSCPCLHPAPAPLTLHLNLTRIGTDRKGLHPRGCEARPRASRLWSRQRG
eukprot:8656975-Pyramimonas_sp.AAC.1